MTFITVKRKNNDRLKQSVWRFYYMGNEHKLVLDHYSEQARPTRRHAYVVGLLYERIGRGRDSMQIAPEIPLDVSDEARDQFLRTLEIGR